MIGVEIFQKAIEFSAIAHREEVRKGDGRPYILHPFNVMEIIRLVKRSSNPWMLGSACMLHDVVENSNGKITLQDICDHFGFHITALVEELTTDDEECQKVGKPEYLSKKMLGMSSYALAIKLADRLHNVRDMVEMPVSFTQKYKKETLHILNCIQDRKLTKTHKKLIKLINKELKKY